MAHATRSVGATIRVWDVPVRLFHWSLVVAIALAFVSSEEDSPLAAWHMVAGWVAAVLIGFRLCWGFIGNAQARFANFVKPAAVLPHLRELIAGRPQRSIGHNPLGGLAVLALLAGTAAVTWTGIQLTSGGGSEDLHEILAFSLLGLIVVHIVGVVVMSLLTHDNLAQAMLTGRKAAHGRPMPAEPRRYPILAYLGGVAIVGLLVLGVTRYEAGAFIPGSREEAEHAEQHAALGGPVLEAEDDD